MKSKKKQRPTSVYFSEPMLKELKTLAAIEGRTLSNLIIRLLQGVLK